MTTTELNTASDALVARISEQLAADAHGLSVTGVVPIVGGHSGLTYRVTTDGPSFVVKAVPEGQRSIGRHDMMRQARILRALGPTDVPVPGVVVVDDTEPAWFAMELVEGESLEPVLDDPAVEPTLAAERMLRASEMLRGLHAVPLDAIPFDGTVLTPADELERWARTMHAVPPELVQGAAELEKILAQNIPQGMTPTLVHGDYRLGNIIAAGTELAALIDWEIWSVGDPRVELGWFLVFADGTNFPGVGRVVEGLPSADELCAAYVGDGESLTELAWFNALGRFKMAAIMGHNLRRHREGRHHDPDQERLPETIRSLVRGAMQLLG
ncbi:MAG: phosphotransferase family protein [Rhodococcus sp. (in: high G+C Gram-positive bacteria)]|uniref:phosphotransferase family protein n=1 Tax=Rhodococcus sp. TaxID=1831 RepID=UPI003BAFCED0